MASPIETYGVTHVHLTVQDAERAATFYGDVFGCKEVFREQFETERLIFINTPGSKDLITLHERSGTSPPEGASHFGFRLLRPDIETASDAIRAAGGQVHSWGDHAPGEPFLNATDTEGNDFQVWYQE